MGQAGIGRVDSSPVSKMSVLGSDTFLRPLQENPVLKELFKLVENSAAYLLTLKSSSKITGYTKLS